MIANRDNVYNLILSGGGIRGIAFIGALDVVEKKGIAFRNIAGVSAGSLVGSLLTAGLNSRQLGSILDSFNCEQVNDISRKVPVILKYKQFVEGLNPCNYNSIDHLFFSRGASISDKPSNIHDMILPDRRENILNNIIKFCKDGCLYDGDYLEEWVYKILRNRGIKTFADLRGGLVDKANPNGYRMRMTAVDATRGKIVVLPDDIDFYGVKPDNLEVSKAIRMSTSAPFIFKPVEIKTTSKKPMNTCQIIDGGIFDNFPFWLIDSNSNEIGRNVRLPILGMKLIKTEQKNILSNLSFLNIFKAIISANHDLGIPHDKKFDERSLITIATSDISSMDFYLSDIERKYLITVGRDAALSFLGEDTRNHLHLNRYIGALLLPVLLQKRRFFFKN